MDRLDVVPRPVVPDDADDRHAVTNQRVVLHAVEPERTVPVHDADPGVGLDRLRCESERSTNAKTSERPGVEETARPTRSEPLSGCRDNVPTIGGNDRVIPEEVCDLAREALGMHRSTIDGCHLVGDRLLLLLEDGDLVDPVDMPVAGDVIDELGRNGSWIRNDADLRGAIPSDPRRLGIDLYHRCLRRDLLPESSPEIPVDTESQHDIGVPECIRAGAIPQQRVVPPQRPPGEAVQEHGRLERIDET